MIYMEPLVSIIIVTYNSSRTIVETLDSAKNQTYGPIEVIISDDHSTDNTVNICEKWIQGNGYRFTNCKLLTATENKGVSANFNQAIINANGEWAKLIAGDDIMLPNCIENNIYFIHDNPDAHFIFSKMGLFTVKGGEKVIVDHHPKENKLPLFYLSAEEQHRELFKQNFLPAPTLFCRMKSIKENLYNEQYRYCEDYPQWFLLTKKGYKLYLNPNETVLYRMSDSLTNSTKLLYNPYHLSTFKLFYYNEMADFLQKNDIEEYNRRNKSLFISDFAIHVLKNKSTVINRFILRVLSKYLYKE